jgi:hypothetical protein
MRNSASGNPRYQVYFTDGTSGPTKADADFAFAISDSIIGKKVNVTWDNGMILRIVNLAVYLTS